MNVNAQDYLDLLEQTGQLCFFDIEATGLRGDYNSVLVVSVKPYGQNPVTFHVNAAGNDKGVVNDAKHELEKYQVWCGYYSKGFDLPMLNTRLLRHHLKPVDKRPHIDMYYVLKYNLLTARRSQGHLLDWLDTDQKKMSVSAEDWNKILHDTTGTTMKTMIKRCESDGAGLEALYRRTRHVIQDIKR